MKQVFAFFRIIRPLNLVFIFLAQWLCRYSLVLPVFRHYGIEPALDGRLFFLLSLSTVLIAAGGYIINDYFDVKIDQINKPGSLVVDRHLSRRQAIFLHWLITFAGIAIGAYVASSIGRLHLVSIHLLAAVLLWFYSATLKCTPLIGNIVVSLLTALSVVIVALFEIWIINRPAAYDRATAVVAILVLAYALFAFLISMLRELLKDLEDIRGDEVFFCRTLPNVAGMKRARLVSIFFAVLLLLAVSFVTLMEALAGHYLLALYGFLAVILPLTALLAGLRRADTKKAYHRLSNAVKAIMLAGILSMLFLHLLGNPEKYFF